MIKVINEVRKCLANESYIAALTLALTLPDIGGKVMNEIRREDSSVGVRYKDWYYKYVSHFYTSDGKRKANTRQTHFTSEMCYKLRCSVLHDGNNNVKVRRSDIAAHEKIVEGKTARYKFSLINGDVAEGVDTYTNAENNSDEYSVTVNITLLCERLCVGAEEFYKEFNMNHQSIFNRHKISYYQA